jgi:hypothetical protein
MQDESASGTHDKDYSKVFSGHSVGTHSMSSVIYKAKVRFCLRPMKRPHTVCQAYKVLCRKYFGTRM